MKKKILILQPVIPNYRLDFFDKLYEDKSIDLKIKASNKDMIGVKTCTEAKEREYIELIGNFISFFNIFFWQRGLRLQSILWADVVVISGNPRLLNHVLFLLFCKITKRKVVWWGQGWTAGSHGLNAKIRRQLMRLADALALYTEKEAIEFSNHKLAIGLNNGLNTKKIRKELSTVISQRDENSDVIHLCFIGRLTQKSKLDILLSSLVNVDRKVKLSIIGDGILKSRLEQFIHDNLKLKSNIDIQFHGAIYNEHDIGEITQISDAFIYPGAVGLSLIHAYCHGLPALVHGDNNNHMPEYAAFKPGVNGLNIPQETKDLSKFINSIDLLQLRSMRDAAINTVINTFNTDDMAKRFISIIKKD
ncbi:glycosyltransferase [Proteus terrae]|uniref:glycosyltransferase n=1 Tax=Proteus terrae TaxID=1574161 RepID=UPI000D69A5A9|nr:glycosyltransferase [Proteus terrae]